MIAVASVVWLGAALVVAVAGVAVLEAVAAVELLPESPPPEDSEA